MMTVQLGCCSSRHNDVVKTVVFLPTFIMLRWIGVYSTLDDTLLQHIKLYFLSFFSVVSRKD